MKTKALSQMCLLVERERFKMSYSSLQFRGLENKQVKTVMSKQNCVCPGSWSPGIAFNEGTNTNPLAALK